MRPPITTRVLLTSVIECIANAVVVVSPGLSSVHTRVLVLKSHSSFVGVSTFCREPKIGAVEFRMPPKTYIPVPTSTDAWKKRGAYTQ